MTTCPACAFCFDPAAAARVCAACPIGKGCTLTCCPNCGWSTPDAAQSRVLRVARAVRRRRQATGGSSLADARPGSHVRIEGMDELPARRRDQLLAYGVAPGRYVDVVQSTPVTVVRVEALELALERSLSGAIDVSSERAQSPRASR
ncbi:MAG: ferrous iron transport protein A [Actinomycetota bacterium]